MTHLELLNRALFALSAGEQQTAYWMERQEEADLAITYALKKLAVEIADDRDRRHWLQKDYSLTLDANGAAIFSAQSSPVTDLVAHSIPSGGRVKDADGNRLVYLATRADLERSQNPMLGYYALSGAGIYTKQINSGSLTDTSGPLTVTSNFIPLATTVPAVLTTRAVELVAEELVGAQARGEVSRKS